MSRRLQDEIRQSRPFESLEVEAFLNLLRTASALSEGPNSILRKSGLSLPQYNVLRILRGARPDGLSGRNIGERMVSRVPDVPRLLDRLERQGLIRRERSDADRRVVNAWITDKGLGLLATLDEPLPTTLKRDLAHMAQPHLQQLIALLETAREKVAAPQADDASTLTSDDGDE